MIPLYILGLLQRFGPQHGYQIKKLITDGLSDFTAIKLPTIYYHLEKMTAEGLVSPSSEKPGSRPQKTVYQITETGITHFNSLLLGLLDFDYRPTFTSDGLFYFSEYIDPQNIAEHLQKHIQKLEHILEILQKHKNETLKFVPEEMYSSVHIIFSHHEYHFTAERDWAADSLRRLLERGKKNG